jgi:hypothetical protein
VLLDETVRHVFQIDKGLVITRDIENAGGLSAIAQLSVAVEKSPARVGKARARGQSARLGGGKSARHQTIKHNQRHIVPVSLKARDERGRIRPSLDRPFVDRLGQMRGPGESYSDVILRVAKASTRRKAAAPLKRKDRAATDAHGLTSSATRIKPRMARAQLPIST